MSVFPQVEGFVSDRLRSLPSVDRVLESPELAGCREIWARRAIVTLVRSEIARARESLRSGGEPVTVSALARKAAQRLERLDERRPRRVINASGVVVHTNLGRAPLGNRAVEELGSAASGYCDLEFDVASGGRGDRHSHVADLLALLFPEHSSLVVNNNAAALLLALNTLARGREVVISRGELVEIGGSFRVPEILERSGCMLVEVGTTNRTHPHDYEKALGENTALILQVWPSNFRVVGFTRSVALEELARLGTERGLPVVVDQGCGRLFSSGPGPSSEVSVEELLAAGASIVCFSGDKLLGGPQAGVLVGSQDLIDACSRNPLARALRPGKLTLSALASTCRAWLLRDPCDGELPVARMLSLSPGQLRDAAERLAGLLREAAAEAEIDVVEGVSRVGGGAAPEEDLPTFLVRMKVRGLSEARLLQRLRTGSPPVVARAASGSVVFDPRTLEREELELLAGACARALR